MASRSRPRRLSFLSKILSRPSTFSNWPTTALHNMVTFPNSCGVVGTSEGSAAQQRASTLMTRPNTQGISPFFIVSNVDQTITFYRDKLGFETRFQEPDRNPFFCDHRPRRSATLRQIRQRCVAAPEPQASSLDEVGRLCLCTRAGCACRRICRSWRCIQRTA
jgi:hypothetical protein